MRQDDAPSAESSHQIFNVPCPTPNFTLCRHMNLLSGHELQVKELLGCIDYQWCSSAAIAGRSFFRHSLHRDELMQDDSLHQLAL